MHLLYYISAFVSVAASMPTDSNGGHKAKDACDKPNSPTPESEIPLPFTMKAKPCRQPAPFKLEAIQAVNGTFVVGKHIQAASYCPTKVGEECNDLTPNTTAVVCDFSHNVAMPCDLNVVVPGGQQMYVRNDTGKLAFTTPHSVTTISMASGSFYTSYSQSNGEGRFDFMRGKEQGWMACPVNKHCNGATGKGCFPYSIHAKLTHLHFSTKCIHIEVETHSTNATAWEYL